MKKTALIIIFLLAIIISLSIVKVIMYNRLSTSGVFVGKVEDEINFYKTQNAILLEKVLIAASLTNISPRAIELGFMKGVSLMTFASWPLAIKQ